MNDVLLTIKTLVHSHTVSTQRKQTQSDKCCAECLSTGLCDALAPSHAKLPSLDSY